ncbi:MAG TPA: 4-alpha-glucanotransferase, partial [Candidatus Eisenbacteria bacterium]|nr:4-alpha-glucanotransferase [Candidatus Eisenbacteria bacterium]
MKVIFRLRYSTRYGEALFLTGDHELLGNREIDGAIPLGYVSPEYWETTLNFSKGAAPNALITYNYILRSADGSVIVDSGKDRAINPAQIQEDELLIIDSWNSAADYENVFYTEPFKDVLLKSNRVEYKALVPRQSTHTFLVKAPLLQPNQTLCLLGNCAALGNWHTNRVVLLSRRVGEDFLGAQVDLGEESFPILYKYGVYDLKSRTFVAYEAGENRILNDTIAANKRTVVNDGFAKLPATTWKGAGVAIPVFSLRSERSFGIGEFTDLKLMADWAKEVGLKLIQILPVNDTTASHTKADSYPYSAISAFALNPVYINLAETVSLENKPLLQELEPERKRLNKLEALDYEAVAKAKLEFLERVYSSQSEATFASQRYQGFLENNKQWLEPYAAFCFLRDRYRSTVYEQWPEYSKYDAREAAA